VLNVIQLQLVKVMWQCSACVCDFSDLSAVRLLLPTAQHVHDPAILGSDRSADVPLWEQAAKQYCCQEVCDPVTVLNT